MSEDPLTISVGDSIPDIVDMFLKRKFRSLPVVNDSGYPVGILTEFELTKTFIHIHFTQSTNTTLCDYIEILDIPTVIEEEASMADVMKAIGESSTKRVLVINNDEQRLTGIISPRDILNFLKGEQVEQEKMAGRLDSFEKKLEVVEAEKEQLEKKIHLFSSVYDDSPYMMHSVNRHGIVIMANKKLHQSLGFEEGQLIGRTVFDIYPKEHHDAAKTGLAKLIKEGKHTTVYTQLLANDRTLKPVDVTSSAVYDKKGMFICTISISREIKTESLWKALQSVESLKAEKKTGPPG